MDVEQKAEMTEDSYQNSISCEFVNMQLLNTIDQLTFSQVKNTAMWTITAEWLKAHEEKVEELHF